MKKLLSVALCAAATMAFAEDVSVAVANVGVTKITIPSGQKNTIIASSFNALGSTSGVTIEKLIRSATGLADNDQLMIFTDGTYYSFKYTDGKWVASTEVTSTGTSSSTKDVTTATTVGQGIWFIRNDVSSSDAVTLVLYGATPTTTSVTTTAESWNLIGNPTENSYTHKTGAEGDRIITVESGSLREWIYGTISESSTGWYYETVTTETKTVGQQSIKVAKKAKTSGNPTLAAGIGFWYYTPTSTTIKWTTGD